MEANKSKVFLIKIIIWLEGLSLKGCAIYQTAGFLSFFHFGGEGIDAWSSSSWTLFRLFRMKIRTFFQIFTMVNPQLRPEGLLESNFPPFFYRTSFFIFWGWSIGRYCRLLWPCLWRYQAGLLCLWQWGTSMSFRIDRWWCGQGWWCFQPVLFLPGRIQPEFLVSSRVSSEMIPAVFLRWSYLTIIYIYYWWKSRLLLRMQ